MLLRYRHPPKVLQLLEYASGTKVIPVRFLELSLFNRIRQGMVGMSLDTIVVSLLSCYNNLLHSKEEIIVISTIRIQRSRIEFLRSSKDLNELRFSLDNLAQYTIEWAHFGIKGTCPQEMLILPLNTTNV